ncbi:MAG: alanine--tRNA ligase [Verrucomicrobia bacterium]|nr:alanine--tRNA ligase [Verrucomicrobiota bacterium]
MTSSQIRQSFLDFFRSKQHTLVPSSSLLPDSPNLLFTNAGMNQFVPIFLGQKAPDVSRWAGAVPGLDTRAADTQKCIRAGGKHNDLEDVGLDTYHHTFFEMLGNWSFGDYFKREAIEWAWELVTEVWKFPRHRLYATVYQPDAAKGDPSEFDQEAYDHWARLFQGAGLDPKVHIRTGGKKDNFWMMGDTGPCGPCSELHVDLTPAGDTRGELVNAGSPKCIEIWNLVFIQFNANPDGTFSPLPARHVDTGMGFERVTSILQCTKNFTDFSGVISNYETDVFRPLFDALEKLSGKRYGSTLPSPGAAGAPEQEQVDIAFRVIADHIRTLSFAIADGIQPGNTDRNYVLRRILRRAVRYGRTLGFHEPFFFRLVAVLADTMGDVFPEIRAKQKLVEEVIRAEEESFNKTLDRGILRFNEATRPAQPGHGDVAASGRVGQTVPGAIAFELYDTYGFPLDLTELMARERGLTVDVEGFNRLMEEQKARARAAQKKTIIELSQIETTLPTHFVGFDTLETPAKVLEVVQLKDRTAVILDTSACYAEMGGQVGDTGTLRHGDLAWRIVDTRKSGDTWLHLLDSSEPSDLAPDAPPVGASVTLMVDRDRRLAIQRHHTVTHLLHWALHEVVSRDASQKGSYVGPEKLTFDFNHAPLTPQQVADVERLVNERILENAGVSWTEVKYSHVKDRRDIMQFFGDKYGDWVRVVQIGGRPAGLDGYSMELCGGTHTRATGEIGLFRIVSETAIAAGVRRIEAVAGLEAWRRAGEELAMLRTVAGRLATPLTELDKKIESLLAHQKELERQVKLARLRNASNAAGELLGRAQEVNGVPLIAHNLGDADGDFLQAIADDLKGRFRGVVVLGGAANDAVALVATVSPEFTSRFQAGKIIQHIAPIVGGKGGGRPDNARGGGKDVSKLDQALAKARTLL